MGRKKIYNTLDEKLEANRKKSARYYAHNKEVIQKKRMKRYYKKTNKTL